MNKNSQSPPRRKSKSSFGTFAGTSDLAKEPGFSERGADGTGNSKTLPTVLKMALQSQVACGVVIGEGRLGESSNLTLRFFSAGGRHDQMILVLKPVLGGGGAGESAARWSSCSCSHPVSACVSWQTFLSYAHLFTSDARPIATVAPASPKAGHSLKVPKMLCTTDWY